MKQTTTFGVVGLGNVGRGLLRRLHAGELSGGVAHAVAHRRPEEARQFLADIGSDAAVLPLDELVQQVDIVVETATADALPEIADAAIGAGKTLVIISSAGMLECGSAIAKAEQGSGRMVVANGMMPGLDIIRAAKESGITSVRLNTTLKPESLRGEPYIEANGIRLPGPGDEPVQVFDGSAGLIAKEFPRHFNVAVALSIAGAGLEDTRVTVRADPAARGATHRVSVDSDAVRLELTAAGYPSKENPRTSKLVVSSVLATMRRLIAPIQIGG